MKHYHYSKEFKKWIRRLAEKYRNVVFAGEYAYSICWCDKTEEGRDANGTTAQVVASISADHRYLECTIHITPVLHDYWKQGSYERVARAVFHEFCHLLVDPVYFSFPHDKNKELQEYRNDIRERQVQRVAYAIFNYLPEKSWQYKKKKNGKTKQKRK